MVHQRKAGKSDVFENGSVVPANFIGQTPKKKIFHKFMAEIDNMKTGRHMSSNIYEGSESKKKAIAVA